MHRHTVLAVAITSGVLSGVVAAQTRFEPIALTGQPAPHPTALATFGPPLDPNHFAAHGGRIDSFGRLTFWALAESPGRRHYQVVTGGAGSLRYVLELGQDLPDDPAYFIQVPYGLNSNDAGQVAVSVEALSVSEARARHAVLLFDPATGLRTAVREGSPVQNMPGVTVDSIPLFDIYTVPPVLNARGETAVRAILSDRGGLDALLVADAGGVRRAVRWPDALPGYGWGGSSTSSLGEPSIDDAGRLSFYANPSGGGQWRGAGAGSLVPLFLGDDAPLPSFPAGCNQSFAPVLLRPVSWNSQRDWPVTNGAGTALAVGNVFPLGASGGRVRAVVAGEPGGLTLVMRGDRPIAGLPAGVTLSSDSDPFVAEWTPVLNESHGFALQAVLTGPGVHAGNDAAVFGGTFDRPGLLAREGEPLPALSPDAPPVRLTALAVTSRNETLLLTSPLPPNPRENRAHHAAWLAKPGRLRPLLRVGDTVEIAPGDARTVARFDFGTWWTPSTQARVINDAGQAAVGLMFTDGSGGMFRVTFCRADFDDSGAVGAADVFAFLAAWFGADPWADLDGDGTAGIDDIFAYLSLYFRGC